MVNAGVVVGEKSEELKQLEKLAPEAQRKRMPEIVQEEVAAVLGFASPRDADLRTGLFDMGMDSISSVDVRNRLEQRLGWRLPATTAFDYPTIEKLADYLCESALGLEPETTARAKRKRTAASRDTVAEPIAVVGLAGRLPGARGDMNQFATLMMEGADLIQEVPAERWDIDAYYDPDPEAPGKMYCRYGSFLDDVDKFDPKFFGISPREALSMDPQQRLMLEIAWETIESAGISPAKMAGSRTSVFVGVTATEYARILATSRSLAELDAYFVSGNALNAIAGRLSHALELHGPSASIDTACSSSLVTVHMACESLRSGESDAALAGGVNLTLMPESTLATCKARMLSADGSCKTFDAQADGYVRGEGAGLVLLKRLEDARAAGDRVLAVIHGSAVNQDGRSSGLTVPNGVAQQALIREALANAGLQPSDVDYIEAHGSGTALGDPIELEALGAVFKGDRNGADPLWVASAKSNIGHLEAAAGITGLIKVVLALGKDHIPPHIHFKNPTPHVNWDAIALRVPTEAVPWPRSARPRVAGVSSFGFSGTNAHVIVGEAAQEPERDADWQRPRHLLALSATTEAALQEQAAAYFQHLQLNEEMDIADVCYTAGAGRTHFEHRLALHADTVQEAMAQLARLRTGLNTPEVARNVSSKREEPQVAFLFTGQGAQYVGMGLELYETQPVYRRALDRCDEILRQHLDQSLISVLFDSAGENSLLDQTRYTQPALFAVEFALAEMWKSWGITPAWVMGHSVGEYVAACVAGVFSLEDGLKLIAARGRLMQELHGGGAMVALMTDATRVTTAVEKFSDKISLAAVNSHHQVVLSGDREALESVVEEMKSEGVSAKWLQVSHAFHSPLMDPMLSEFAEICGQVTYSPAKLSVISNLSGEIADEAISTADYWCKHVRAPVQFASGMETLVSQGVRLFVEAGPQPTLIRLAEQFIEDGTVAWLPSLPSPRSRDVDAWGQLLSSLAQLYVRGAPVDFEGFDDEYGRRKVELPTYRFQQQSFWAEPSDSSLESLRAGNLSGAARDGVLGQRLSLPRSKEIRFQSTMTSNSPAFLDDHRLFGTVVCPGASHIATMLVGTASGLRDEMYVIEDIYFPEALVLQDGSHSHYQLAMLPEERGGYFIQSMSMKDDNGDSSEDAWVTHAAAKLRKATEAESTPPVAQIDLEAFKSTCAHEIPGEDFYRTFWEAGYTLGESFQWVDHIYRNDWEGVVRMRVPEIQENLEDYILHPGLIDSCLQALAAFGKTEAIFMPGEDVIRIPFHVGRIKVYGRPKPGTLWFHGRLGQKEGEEPVGWFQLLDAEGLVIAEVEGYESRRISKAILLSVLKEDTSQWLYEVAWQARESDAATWQPDRPGTWLILGDDYGVAAGLMAPLKALGERCVLVTAGEGYKQSGEDHYQVNPSQRADFDRLFAEALGEGAPPLRSVMHLWSIDALPATESSWETIERELRTNCSGALHALQGWAARNETKWPRWFLVTRGAQAVESSSSRPLALAGSALWGFGRVLAAEHPELACLRIDLDPEAGAEESATMLSKDVLVKQPDEDQVAYRNDTRYAPRLVRCHRGGDHLLSIPSEGPFRLQLSSFGVLDNLEFATLTRRQPQIGEVEIEVVTSGLNFRDVLRALGMLQEYERSLGILSAQDAVFGLECGGRVVAVGDQVTEFNVGDEVIGLVMGSMTSHATVPVQYIAPKPANVSFEAAVATSFTMMTAIRALEQGADLKAGERVLIHAAAGGVGQAAVQLAQRIGAEVFGTASARKWEFLTAQGVPHVMNSRTLDFADQIMELTNGEGVDVVLNSLNGDYIPKSLSVLKPGGRFIEIGAIGIWQPEQVAEFRDDISYERFDMLDEEVKNPGSMGQKMRDVLGRLGREELEPLEHKAFSGAEAVEAFRFVAQAKHIGKIMVTLEREAKKDDETQETRIREDASYLVTGGLGALGREVAQWLAEQGARHLVLTGRRGAATPEAKRAVADLTEAGVDVLVSQTDMTDGDQVSALIRQVDSTRPPLKGIMHAAGVLDDGILMEQDWDRFAKVVAPKAAGAWHLYEQTRAHELDFFVSFSSIASLLGSAGQGNYATANAFLDGLAQQLQREGLRGLSINWGPWSEVGMAADLSRRDRARWAAAGIGMISTKQGLEILGKTLSASGQIGAVPVDWTRLLANLSGVPFFGEFLAETGYVAGERSKFLEQLEETPVEERRELLSAHVISEVSRVLGLDSNDPLPLETGFFELGIDSLTAVELRNRLERSLGGALPATLIFNYPTLSAMIEYFAEDVLEIPRVDELEAEPAATAEEPAEEVGDQFDDLSMDDMADLLKDKLAEMDEVDV